MESLEFPYVEEESKIFNKVKRPKISIDFLSKLDGDWLTLDDVLVDTGADVSMMPRYIGELAVDDITTGKYVEIKGIEPSAVLSAFIHELNARIADKEFELPVAIADSNDVPSVLGRIKGLDIFDVDFIRGDKIKISW